MAEPRTARYNPLSAGGDDPGGFALLTADLIRLHALDQRRRGLAEGTITIRRRVVTHLGDWVAPRGVLECSSEDVQTFLDSRRLSPGARYSYLSNLHSFFEWAIFAGHTTTDPTAQIRRPKVHQGQPRPIGTTDLELVLSLATGELRVIIALAAFAGLRAVEISRLRREDVLNDVDPPVLAVIGKGNKPRTVPLHPIAADALAALPMPASGPVLRSDGLAMPAWRVSLLGNMFLHGVGVGDTLHSLRHWFASGVYRTSGKDLLLVRDLLGHSSVRTTTVYAQFDRAGAAAAVLALGSTPTPEVPV